MGMMEVWICDSCGAEERTQEGDGPSLEWAKNIDDEDFCPKCALTLDPSSESED